MNRFGSAGPIDSLPAPQPPQPNVACPHCGDVPTEYDRWICAPDGCGHSWNTFATRARCPECGAQFAWTACLRCGRISAHEAWYR